MAFDVPKAIEALGKATEKGFAFAETAKTRQSETEIIKDRKNLQKAVNIAEKLFILTAKYYFTAFSDEDKQKFGSYLKDFLKYN